MMDIQVELKKGNQAFREGDYETALSSYERALRYAPESLKASLAFNKTLAERRLRAKHGAAADEVIARIQRMLALEDEINIIRPHFDSDYYLASNPDVAQAEIDPVLHYCEHGWQERRDPHPGFSTHCYLEGNPDVAAAGLNPFRHFIEHGRDEGRRHLPLLANGVAHHANCEQVDPLTWRAHNDDPQFILNAQHFMPMPGWYWLAAHVMPTRAFDVCKLYLDFSSGFSEKDAIQLPIKKKAQAAGRVLRITEAPVGMRFDPQTTAGEFEIRGFA
ncbi:MAG: hypothetical protein N2690_07905, partial [Rhodocyclaceae bacterium]|nr:hypothetical protein [Rhodocyclaceae bacterium]